MLAFTGVLPWPKGSFFIKEAIKCAFDVEKRLHEVVMLGVSPWLFERPSVYRSAMPMMRAQRREGQVADVVLGPCPGCDSWQLDYTDEVALQYVTLYPPEAGYEGIQINMNPWYEQLEAALAEHVAECPHLRDLLTEY